MFRPAVKLGRTSVEIFDKGFHSTRMTLQPVLGVGVVKQGIMRVIDSNHARQSTLCILVSIPHVLRVLLNSDAHTRSTPA